MQNQVTQARLKQAVKMFNSMRTSSTSSDEDLLRDIASVMWVDFNTLNKKLWSHPYDKLLKRKV